MFFILSIGDLQNVLVIGNVFEHIASIVKQRGFTGLFAVVGIEQAHGSVIDGMCIGEGGHGAGDSVKAGERDLDINAGGGFGRSHLDRLCLFSAKNIAQAHARRGAFFIRGHERAYRVFAGGKVGEAEAAMTVAQGVDGPGIHQSQADIGPAAFFRLAEELKVHADGRASVIEGHGAGDLRGALDLNGDLGDAVYAHCDLGEVILPLLDGVVALFPAGGEGFELVRVEGELRVQVTFQRGEGVVAAGLDGLQPEAAVEIGDGRFRGGQGIGVTALFAFFGDCGEDDGGEACRLAGVRAKNDAGNHALGGIGLFVLELVASGQQQAGDGQNREPTQPRQAGPPERFRTQEIVTPLERQG